MKLSIASLSTNAQLGLLLVTLGFVGLFLGDPYGRATATIDTAELAEIVQREVDHVSPEQLADWIIRGGADYRIIDLRSPADFEQYHIPGAENVPITGLAAISNPANPITAAKSPVPITRGRMAFRSLIR